MEVTTTTQPNLTQPAKSAQTKPSHDHPTPSRSRDDITKWHQVKRARRQQHSAATTEDPKTGNRGAITSHEQRQKTVNRFAPLEFEIHPTYEDDAVSPITIAVPTSSRKPARRNPKTARKAWTKQLTNSSSKSHQLRHPSHTLQHMSPQQTQVMLRSREERAKPLRDKLLYQIALLRAVRTNTTPQNILLDKSDDTIFLKQVQDRLSKCVDTPPCTTLTPIDIPLRSILDQDEMRVRGSLCFAWMDLITRAALPSIYESWLNNPTWQGLSFRWLPAADADTPCLQDGALAALAACPTLQNAWTHLSKDTPDLDVAIKTAANQWRLYVERQRNNRAGNATPSITNK